MEQIKKEVCVKLRMPLQKAFFRYVMTTFMLVVMLSATVIFVSIRVQRWLLPDKDAVYLHVEGTMGDGRMTSQTYLMELDGDFMEAAVLVAEEDGKTVKPDIVSTRYSLELYDNAVSFLTPKKKLLYFGCYGAMALLPALFSLSGILLCCRRFFQKKLKPPIDILTDAAACIAEQNLDFTIAYTSADEMGALCRSFEQMRAALQENYKRMWEMLEERRSLQASVAHDLRNPIAIIKGHAEYLQINVPKKKLTQDMLLSYAGNIKKAAERLEGYTESVRTINHLEELAVMRREVDFPALYQDMRADFVRMAELWGLTLAADNQVKQELLCLDVQVLYRILENLIGNAVRFAKSRIHLSFFEEGGNLCVTVADDGCGFPEKVLHCKNRYFAIEGSDKNHSGMGLAICRILCKKHGGSLMLTNEAEGGAAVKIMLSV